MRESAPLVTFFLFAYNQGAYIRAACEAALAQTYSPLRVIFSDDFSSDRTFEIMQEVVAGYTGPHEVVLNRNEHNLGLIGHVNRAMELSETDLIVVAAGDDISLPERVATIVKVYQENQGRVFSIHSAVTKIDVDGNLLECWTPPVTESRPSALALADCMSLVIGATHAWTREIFQVFGPINYARAYEDLVIAYRGALLGGLHYIELPLVQYRVGNGGLSTASWESVKSKHERRLRLIKGLGVSIDVLKQRREDCLALHKFALATALDSAIWEKTVSLLVYEKTVPILSVLKFAFKKGCLKAFFKAYFRIVRGVV